MTDAFIQALGGEKAGQVDGNSWSCVCGSSGTADDEQRAALQLYFHRRAGCGPEVHVEMPGRDNDDPLVVLFKAAKAFVDDGRPTPPMTDLIFAVVACEADVDHVCRVTREGWTLRHPVACRVAGLFDCSFNDALGNIGYWASGLGTADYLLGWDEDGGLTFDRIEP
jgi:hypothetical protein